MELADFFKQAWRRAAGMPEQFERRLPVLDELRCSEWSPQFEQLMRNRLIMGAFRYGRFKSPEKGGYDCVSSIIRRIEEYRRTGNDELLVDVANLALVEFEEGRHPRKHWGPSDDTEHVHEILP